MIKSRKKQPHLVLFHQNNAQITSSSSRWPKPISKNLNCFLLAHLYYFLFPNMKRWLGGKRFAYKEEVDSVVDSYFEKFNGSHYIQGIKAIEHRWEKCIELCWEIDIFSSNILFSLLGWDYSLIYMWFQ